MAVCAPVPACSPEIRAACRAHPPTALCACPSLQDATYETVPTKYDGKAQAYLAFIRKNE